MNRCGCGPASLRYEEFTIKDAPKNSYMGNITPVGFPTSTSDNELKLKIIQEFCGVLNKLQCGVQLNLDFILEEISLISKHEYEEDEAIYAQYDALRPIFQELNIDLDTLTPEQIQELIDAYKNLTLVLQGPKGSKGDKGDKGDPFTYEDFTPELLAGLKGDRFVYEDFTRTLLEALRGSPGRDGTNGTSSYIHIAYSTSADGSTNFSLSCFEGASYIGVCVDNDSESPYTYESYEWSRFKGEPFQYSNFTAELLLGLKGPQGEKGDPGEGIADKEYNPEYHSGLGRKTLQLKDGSNILTQEDFNQENTIYVIANDFDLDGETITVPADCVLEFDGGSLNNGVFYGNKCKVLGEPKWGENITYCDVYDNDGSVLHISKVTNTTYFGKPTDIDVDVLTNLNAIIADIANTYGEVTLVFEKDVTYDFGQTILLRDNMTVAGNGCTIQFHTVRNENNAVVTMYPYSAFFTNRKLKSTGSTINDYAVDVRYGEKNITIKNINFAFTPQSENFWFFKNSERGVIALNGAENIRIENCKFNNVYANYPIWTKDVDGLIINGCELTSNEAWQSSLDTCGLLWNMRGYIKNVEISHNKAVCYNDEVVGLFGFAGTLRVHDNNFTSIEQISMKILDGESPEVYIENNKFTTISIGEELDTAFDLSIQNDGDRNMSLLSVKNNIYNYCYGVVQMHRTNYLTIDRVVIEGNKFNDGVCGINIPLVRIRNFRFANNFCAKGIKCYTNIGIPNAFTCIENNETGIIEDRDATDLNNLPINNSISYANGTTIVTGNSIYGSIEFSSSGYVNTLVFNDNNCTFGYLSPISGKKNVITGNFFRKYYMQLAPEEKTKFSNNIVIDNYGNLINGSSYTLSEIDSRRKFHSIGDFVLVDEKLAMITSDGYSYVESGDSGAELVLKLTYADDKSLNYSDYSIVAFNGATKATLTGATFDDGTTEKDFEDYQNPSSYPLLGGTAGSPFTITISNKAVIKQLILKDNPFAENFKISNLKGIAGLQRLWIQNSSKAIGDISNIASILPSLTLLNLIGTNITGNLALLANCTNLSNDWGLVINQSALHGDLSSIPGNVVYMGLPSWTRDESLVATGYQGLTWTPGIRTGSDKSILCLNSVDSTQRFASVDDVDNYFIDNATCSFNGGDRKYINIYVLANYTPSAAASAAIATLKSKGVTDYIKVNNVTL